PPPGGGLLGELVGPFPDGLTPVEDGLEQVAVALDPVQHDVHREVERVEPLVHLVPADRGRTRSALAGPPAAPSTPRRSSFLRRFCWRRSERRGASTSPTES